MPFAETGYDRCSNSDYETKGTPTVAASDPAADHVFGSYDSRRIEDICYYRNAATCPECASGMVRLGTCFSCQACGFQSCGGQ